MARVIHTAQALVDATATIPELPRRGQNVMAAQWSQEAGGAVNILVAAARSGAACVHAGAIGSGPVWVVCAPAGITPGRLGSKAGTAEASRPGVR